MKKNKHGSSNASQPPSPSVKHQTLSRIGSQLSIDGSVSDPTIVTKAVELNQGLENLFIADKDLADILDDKYPEQIKPNLEKEEFVDEASLLRLTFPELNDNNTNAGQVDAAFDQNFLRKIAYGWVDIFYPIKALQILADSIINQKYLESTLIQIVYFIKEMILADVHNQFILAEDFVVPFKRIITALQAMPSLSKASQFLEDLYNQKQSFDLSSILLLDTNENMPSNKNIIDAKSAGGILALFDFQKTATDSKDIMKIFAEELAQFITFQRVKIPLYHFTIEGKQEKDKLSITKNNSVENCENTSDSNQESVANSNVTFTDIFNKLSNWVTSSILHCIQFLKGPKGHRGHEAIEFWIDVATELCVLGNYEAVFAICAALNSVPISRLELTFKKIDSEHLNKFAELDQVVSDAGNFKKLRTKISEKNGLLPINIVKRDKVFMNDFNVKRVASLIGLGEINYNFFTNQYASMRTIKWNYSINIPECILQEPFKRPEHYRQNETTIDEMWYKKSCILEPIPIDMRANLDYATLTKRLIQYSYLGEIHVITHSNKAILLPSKKDKEGVKVGVKGILVLLKHIKDNHQNMFKSNYTPLIEIMERINVIYTNLPKDSNKKEKGQAYSEAYQKLMEELKALYPENNKTVEAEMSNHELRRIGVT